MKAFGQGSSRSVIIAAAALLALTVAARAASGVREAPWRAHLRAVNAALAAQDTIEAEQAWHDAYLAALGSWRWDGMLEVAHAYLRIGEAAGRLQAAQARARNLYLAALFRAREQRSLDGVLRTAEAFAALGDDAVVEQCLRIAEALAAETRDPRASARVRAWAIELAGPGFTTRERGR